MARRTEPLENSRPYPDDRSGLFQKIMVGATLALAITAIITNFQTCRALQKSKDSFRAAQRAYVAFGSKGGQLAEFSNKLKDGKPIVVLHFFNAGQTTARHFTVHVQGPSLTHMHRFKLEETGPIEREGAVGEMDLAAQAEHAEYLVDPKWLRTRKELDTANSIFVIQGEFEYCDIFGAYHCQQFSTQYVQEVGQFGPFLSANLPCIVDQPDPRVFQDAVYEGKSYKLHEIEPCEQPNEVEYHRITDTIAPSPTGTPTP